MLQGANLKKQEAKPGQAPINQKGSRQHCFIAVYTSLQLRPTPPAPWLDSTSRFGFVDFAVNLEWPRNACSAS